MSKKDDEITREEVVADLEKLQDDIKETVSNKSLQLKALVGGASSLAMLSSFFLGRKSGKKRSSASDLDSDSDSPE